MKLYLVQVNENIKVNRITISYLKNAQNKNAKKSIRMLFNFQIKKFS